MSRLTVEDVLGAQERSIKNLDNTKNCETCLHSGKGVLTAPCDKCINSFMGIVFTPSNWGAKECEK